jgi:hypothetical protein
MVSCGRCGAVLGPDLLACPYCGTVTARGLAEQDRLGREQHAYQMALAEQAANAEQAKRNETNAALARASRAALIWAGAGFLLCCSPLALVGIFLGFRARGIAKAHGLHLPSGAVFGIVLGLVQIALFAIAMVLGVLANIRVDERVAELDRKLAGPAAEVVLSQPTACGLAERHLLSQGFESVSNTSIDEIRCDGALSASGTSAELHDLEFKAGSDRRVRASVCFRRGARWSVDRIAVSGCTAAPAAPASAAGTASAR